MHPSSAPRVSLAPAVAVAAAVVALTISACQEAPSCPPVQDQGVQGRITLGATHVPAGGTFERIYVAGAGTRGVGSIGIDGSVGTVEVGGQSVAAVSYATSTMNGQTLYQTLAVTADRLWLMWFYCAGSFLTRVYFEGTDATVGDELATGTCGTMVGDGPDLDLPAVDMPFPPLSPAYRVQGPTLAYDGVNPGQIVIDGRSLVLLPFAGVDCSSCGSPGWQEMHILAWDEPAARLCIGILYFFGPEKATLSNSFVCLPIWWNPAGDNVDFPVTWQSC